MASQEESRTFKPVYVENFSDLYVKSDKGYISLEELIKQGEFREEKILPMVAPIEIRVTPNTAAESSESTEVMYSSISAQPIKICCISMGPGLPDFCFPYPSHLPCPR